MRRISLALLLTLSALVCPFGAMAQGSITVSDTVAGLGTTIQLSALPPSTTVDVHAVSEAGEDTLIPTTTNAQGNAIVSIPEKLTTEAGTYRVFAVLGQQKITEDAIFEVLRDRIDRGGSRITVNVPFLTADGRSAAIVTVALMDAQSNPLPGRPVQLVGSRAEDRITPLTASRETDNAGVVQFAVQTQTPGDIALRAMDLLSGTMLDQAAHIVAGGGFPVGGFEEATPRATNPFGAQLIAAARYDVPARIVIKAPETAKVRDVLPSITIAVVDAAGNTVESFVGTLKISTPNDNGSTLPGLGLPPGQGEVVITKKGLGKANLAWVMSFSRSGQQKIIVSNASGQLTGEAVVTVSGSAEIPDNLKIRLESLQDGDTVNTREILVKGKGPALANLHVWLADGETPPEAVTEGEPVATHDTESDGSFSFTLKLPKKGDVLMEIRSDRGDDSGIIHLTTDFDGPAIDYALEPQQPREGEDVTLSVTSEPGLPDVLMKIKGQEISLTEGEPGIYEVLFQAPGQGDIDFVLSARDPAGNVTDRDGVLSIAGPNLPQVQNVRAESLAGGIQLFWDVIPDETIAAYRIEVGKSPGRADVTLDTPEPTGEAAVMGLKSGSEYFVTVRGVRGDESGPKSDVIAARTLGMEVTVTPQEHSLLLQWTFPDSTPLASFILEYGTLEAEFSEERTLDGAMRAFTLNDLLAQPYLIRMTPVATTGEVLKDLTVSTEGTPTMAVAFRASADGFAGRPRDTAPDNGLHAGAPDTVKSGLPGISLRLVLGMTVMLAGFYWYRRRKAMMQTHAFLNTMRRKYHS